MYLGIRGIRSAGRNSGSIEITLPAQLHVLEGIECRLSVRDGGQPEIVLQPNFAEALRFIKELWQKVRLGLGDIGDAGEFAATDYTLVLFPPDHWHERPPLVYADALNALHYRRNGADSINESLVPLLAGQAIVAVRRLGLEGMLSMAFGDALAYVVTGCAAGLGADFERGMAHQVIDRYGVVKPSPESPLSDQTWLAWRPVLHRVFEQFMQWQMDPVGYAAARENWYRVLTAEVVLGTPKVSENIEQTGRLGDLGGTTGR